MNDEELVRVDERKKEKNIFQNKFILIALGGIILCVIVAVLFIGNNPVNRAKKLFAESKLEEYKEIKGEMSEEELLKFGDYLEGVVEDIKEKFVSGEYSYSEATEKLYEVSAYCGSKYVENYTETTTLISMLNKSRNSFTTASELEAKGKYIAACKAYKGVIEDDSNYTTAQEKLVNLMDKVVEESISEAEKLADSENYEGALNKVKEALDLVNNDDLNALKEGYQILFEKQKKAEAEAKRQAMLLNTGKEISNSYFIAKYKGANFSKSVKPDNISGAYLYYSCDDDKIYLDLKFSVKNTYNYSKEIEPIVSSFKITYGLNYTYTNYSLFYSQGDDVSTVFSWDTLEPLESATLHLAAQLPEEVTETDLPITIEFTFLGEQQILEFR